MDVDRATHVSIETRVEQMGRILESGALGESQLHDLLVGFARAENAFVRPDRNAPPLPFLDDARNRFLDEFAHSLEGCAAPVTEFGDPGRNEFRRRWVLARGRLLHLSISMDHR